MHLGEEEREAWRVGGKACASEGRGVGEEENVGQLDKKPHKHNQVQAPTTTNSFVQRLLQTTLHM